MNGFRIWTLQDLSYILLAKSLQYETRMSTNIFKRCLSNFLDSSRKRENAQSEEIDLSTVSNNLEPIFTTWLTLPEITTTTFISQSRFLPSKANKDIMRLEVLKSFIKHKEKLNGNPVSRSKCYKMLSNIQADDFGFVCDDNTAIKSDKVYHDGCTSKIALTCQETEELKLNRAIGRESTDDLSVSTTAKSVNFSSLASSKLKTPEIKHRFKLPADNQHARKYDSSQSPEFWNYTQKDLSLDKTERRIQQRSHTSRCVLPTPTKRLPSSFETSQTSNAILKTEECCARIVWFSKGQSHSRREYHTWKTSKIENMIKYNDRRLFASDMRTKTQQEQSLGYRSSRFGHLAYYGSLGNRGSQKSSSCLPSVPRLGFSSRSCTAIQQSVREFGNLRGDPSANASIVRLRSARSYPDRTVKQFSRDASKGSANCEDDKSRRSKREVRSRTDDSTCSRKVARSRCRIENENFCEKTRRKDACASQIDTCEKRPERKSKPCESFMCPELQKLCKWDEERCPETPSRKISSRNRARQSRDSSCSQKQGRQLKSYKQDEDCDEPRTTCKNLKKKFSCESKREKQCVKRDCNEKGRQKCTGSSRKQSNSCSKRNSSQASNKSSRKVGGKRRYSQQSIFSVPRDRKSFSTLTSDIILCTVSKRLYASCSGKDEKNREQGRSCEKRKRKCRSKIKDEDKKKCVKGPAKCIPRETEMKVCRSNQKDKDKISCESTKKTCYEEYCTRKKEFMKDEKLEETSMPSPTTDDKMPMERSIKEQIDREYKEIDECKKDFKCEKKNRAKMISTELIPTGLNRVIGSSKEHQKKDSEKFASTRNGTIISTDSVSKWFNHQSRVINTKDVRLFDITFDRSFSTAKLDYQDDFANRRATNHDKMAQSSSANYDDFIHDDELPNYVEIEYENEDEDVH